MIFGIVCAFFICLGLVVVIALVITASRKIKIGQLEAELAKLMEQHKYDRGQIAKLSSDIIRLRRYAPDENPLRSLDDMRTGFNKAGGDDAENVPEAEL